MKALIAILFLAVASPALGQLQSNGTAVAPGCGPANVEFDAKSNKNQHPTAQPDPGKALVYLLQDDAEFSSRPRPTTRFGIDGAWVGATQSNSYFYVSIDPGEHHLCASWQGHVVLVPARKEAALHFTAEAGNVYYFWAEDFCDTGSGREVSGMPVVILKLKALDSDEALLLMSKFSFSTSNPKK